MHKSEVLPPGCDTWGRAVGFPIRLSAWNLHQGFEPYEFEKFKRIVMNVLYYVKDNENSENVKINRAKFFDFVNDIDSRHNQNYLETFPEMAAFYEKCKEEKILIM